MSMIREPRAGGATRAELAPVVLLFLLACVPRLVHVATVRSSPFFSLLVLDPAMYDEWGWALARGQSWGGGVFFQDPLYAYALAAVYRIAGHHYLPAVALQCVLGAAVAPLVFLAARPWFGRATAVAAGIVAATYLPAVYYDAMILKTSLTVFLVAVTLLLLSRAARERTRRGATLVCAAAGCTLGLAALTRGNLLLLAPLIAVWVFLDAGRHAGSAVQPELRTRAGRGWAAGALLLGCFLVVLPATLRNRVVGGEWVLTTGNAGQNFYIGNNPINDSGEYQRLPFVDPNPKFERRDFAREAARRDPRVTTAQAVSRFWFGQAVDWIRVDPLAWLRLTWRKLRAYWGAFEIPDNLDYYLVRERAPVLRWPLFSFGLVAPFGLLGALLALRSRGLPRLLSWLVAAYSLTVIAFFVLSRFRMAMMPALYVLAAHGALSLGAAARQAWSDGARRRHAVFLASGLAAAAAFVNLPVRARRDSTLLSAARAVGLPVRPETSATGRFNLGVAYAARAKQAQDPDRWLELAERELREAWAEERRFASIPVELGKVLARMGRNREAVEAYLAAAAIEPDDFRTQHALGLLYRRLDDPERAADRFRAALALEPRHAASAVQLGETLLDLGRRDEAAEAFRRALALVPGDENAADGLRRTTE